MLHKQSVNIAEISVNYCGHDLQSGLMDIFRKWSCQPYGKLNNSSQVSKDNCQLILNLFPNLRDAQVLFERVHHWWVRCSRGASEHLGVLQQYHISSNFRLLIELFRISGSELVLYRLIWHTQGFYYDCNSCTLFPWRIYWEDIVWLFDNGYISHSIIFNEIQ